MKKKWKEAYSLLGYNKLLFVITVNIYVVLLLVIWNLKLINIMFIISLNSLEPIVITEFDCMQKCSRKIVVVRNFQRLMTNGRARCSVCQEATQWPRENAALQSNTLEHVCECVCDCV